jgi:hypothetical protein
MYPVGVFVKPNNNLFDIVRLPAALDDTALNKATMEIDDEELPLAYVAVITRAVSISVDLTNAR